MNKLEFPLPKNALCKLVEIGILILEKILTFVNEFALFRDCLPMENGGVLHLNRLETPLPQDALFYVWLKRLSDSGEAFLKFRQ